MKAIGYTRVSTDEQAQSGLGLEDQRQRVVEAISSRGWELVEVVRDDGYTAGNLKRPGIARALAALKSGRADALVVAKLDRLSRSMIDFTRVMEQAQQGGWSLVALDLGVDTSTPSGEMMANVVASFAQYERRLISERTKRAMAVKAQQGYRFGRPVLLPDKVRRRIARERAGGRSFATIAARLNEDGVPTGQGGVQWWPATVWQVMRSLEVDERVRRAS